MKPILIAAVVVASVAFAGAVQATETLAKDKGCLGCHAIDKKKVGPSFKDVAAKYKGKADAEAMLATKIASAKGHPPVKVTQDEAKTLVKWVLTQ